MRMKYCNTQVYSENSLCKYGENYSEIELGKGFIQYAKEKGYKNVAGYRITNPSVLKIITCIGKNYPMLMVYEINVGSDISLHAISVLGYVQATKVASGNTWNYLLVYDGINDNPSHLNYSCVDFNHCSIVYFQMK